MNKFWRDNDKEHDLIFNGEEVARVFEYLSEDNKYDLQYNCDGLMEDMTEEYNQHFETLDEAKKYVENEVRRQLNNNIWYYTTQLQKYDEGEDNSNE